MMTDAKFTAMRAVQAEAMTQTATIRAGAEQRRHGRLYGGIEHKHGGVRIAPTLNMPDDDLCRAAARGCRGEHFRRVRTC